MSRPRIVTWFSCGDASAVTVKLVQARYGKTHDIAVARCVIAEEHEDNDRFAADCEKWFGAPIINLSSTEYASCEEVWTKRRYLSGVNGAPCTTEMKKAVRWAFEKSWRPDLQAFGYTADEKDRAALFRQQNPDVKLITPLIDDGLGKEDCHALVSRAGIELPAMYRLGYENNNCFSGDTEFITDTGVRTLRSAVGEKVRVRGSGGGWKAATIHSFGIQPLMRVTLQRNGVRREIHATAGHRWFVKQYAHAPKVERITQDLRPGDKLRSVFGGLGARVRASAFGIAQGIVFGDGTRGSTLNTAATLVLCGDKNMELLPYFSMSPRNEIATGIEIKDLPRHWKDRPPINECQSFLYGWLAGYFAADGHVSDGEYILSSASRGNLEFARDVAIRLGIGTNGIRSALRTGFDGREPSVIYTLPLIGATLRADFFLLSGHRDRFLSSSPREPHPWTVVSVVPTDRTEEVFCAVVPDGQAFVLEGNILTGNCIGCVKASSVRYWQRVRRTHPEVFASRAALSRELGVRLIKLGGGERERMFLDDLPADLDDDSPEPSLDCSLLCYLAEQDIKGAA